MDTLLIHYNPYIPDQATWALANAGGELTSMVASGPLTEATPLAEKHKTVVILDSSVVHINSVRLPVKNRQKLLQAIPFALEDQLAEDVDELHFVAAKAGSNGDIPVAAIKHTLLKQILSTMSEFNISPTAIVPDVLCLTANQKQWAILLHDDKLKVQYNTLSGGEFDTDIEIIKHIVSSNLGQQDSEIPEKVMFITLNEGDEASRNNESINNIRDAISDFIDNKAELINIGYNTHPLVIFCGQFQNALPLNILQGAYKPKNKENIKWQKWKLSGALAATLLVLHLGTAGFQYINLKDENNQLGIKINQVYKSTFPDSRIRNAEKQMKEELNALKGGASDTSGTSIISLLASSASALATDTVTIQSIKYRNGSMDIDLTGKNLQAVESVNKELNNHYDIKAEIITSSSEKDQVKGSIRVKKSES